LADQKLLGKWGQKQSEKFLKKKGFKSLTKNFSCKTGEIDLIMVDADGTIVFIEVKSRKDETFARAESAVNHSKRHKLSQTAKFFLRSCNIEDRPCRFDIVTVILDKSNSVKINHYENAFVP
jgi:putative endonuclease